MSASIDTIAALATPPGRGGIGVVRLSGPHVPDIAVGVLRRLPRPRHATFADFLDAEGQAIDQGLALYFPAPHSFTGEAVLELQGHGGVVVMDRLLRRVLELGARLARPGEFSERAFLNGKIDLLQAEAIADLIDSASAQAARCAMHSLQGEFSRLIRELADAILALRGYVEAGIDFPDEELDLLADGQVTARIGSLLGRLDGILEQARQGFLLREGMHLVIVGAPNVGKSSLLNRLAGRDTAIVTDIPGTTRDIVRDSIHLDGMPLHITDTAGLRDTADPVEQEGIRRAREAMKSADLVLVLVDDRDLDAPDAGLLAEIPENLPVLVIRNKCDLSGRPAGFDARGSLRSSAKHGAGLAELRRELRNRMGFQGEEGGTLLARRRHLDALHAARAALQAGLAEARAGHSELTAESLRQAQQALGEITGQVTSEDLLEHIFGNFCIGK